VTCPAWAIRDQGSAGRARQEERRRRRGDRGALRDARGWIRRA